MYWKDMIKSSIVFVSRDRFENTRFSTNHQMPCVLYRYLIFRASPIEQSFFAIRAQKSSKTITIIFPRFGIFENLLFYTFVLHIHTSRAIGQRRVVAFFVHSFICLQISEHNIYGSKPHYNSSHLSDNFSLSQIKFKQNNNFILKEDKVKTLKPHICVWRNLIPPCVMHGICL